MTFLLLENVMDTIPFFVELQFPQTGLFCSLVCLFSFRFFSLCFFSFLFLSFSLRFISFHFFSFLFISFHFFSFLFFLFICYLFIFSLLFFSFLFFSFLFISFLSFFSFLFFSFLFFSFLCACVNGLLTFFYVQIDLLESALCHLDYVAQARNVGVKCVEQCLCVCSVRRKYKERALKRPENRLVYVYVCVCVFVCV